jgi:hypothetical protein
MSPSGQSRHFDRARATSGLPRTTDIVTAGRHFSFVPKPEVTSLCVTALGDERPASLERCARGA